MFYVYKIINKINGKIYIGKTKEITKRWKKHLMIARGGKKKYPRLFFALHAAICKYGEDNFSFEIKQNFKTEKSAFNKEKYFIKNYKSKGYILYNLTNGGGGPSGAKRSIEARKKMSLARRKEGYTTGKQKLTVDQVKEIKQLLIKNKIKIKDIAKLFSVSYSCISAIHRERCWSWVK